MSVTSGEAVATKGGFQRFSATAPKIRTRILTSWSLFIRALIIFVLGTAATPSVLAASIARTASRGILVEVTSTGGVPGGLQNMTDDLYPSLVVFDDGTVIADRNSYALRPLGPETSRMFKIAPRVAQQFRNELVRAGAVDKGGLTVGHGEPDLVFGILIEIESGLTKVGTSSDTPSTDPRAREIPAVLAAFDKGLANPLPVPSELAHQHVIYQTGEGFMRTKCFPIGMQRAMAIRRALTNSVDNYIWVGGQRVYDIAVITGYGHPPRHFPPFDDPTCKREPSQPIVIRH